MSATGGEGLRVILFDLGGVIVELRGVETFQRWLRGPREAEALWADWLASPAVRAFEKGASTQTQFAADLIAEMRLPASRAEFLEAFVRIPKGLYPEAGRLLRRCRERYYVASLSNTNALHWERLTREMGIEALFDRHFVSHLTGRLKPDRGAFEYVVERLGVEPQAILFIDDNAANVQAAAAVGMRALRAEGARRVERLLEGTGVLPQRTPA